MSRRSLVRQRNDEDVPNSRSPEGGLAWGDLWPTSAPALAFAGDFVGVTADRAVGLPTVAGVVVVATVTALCSRRVNAVTALGVAVLGWLFVTGFVLNSYGELHVHRLTGVALLVLLLAIAEATAMRDQRRGATS